MVIGREVREDRVRGLDGRTRPGFRPFQKPVVQLSSMTTLKQSTLHFSMVGNVTDKGILEAMVFSASKRLPTRLRSDLLA